MTFCDHKFVDSNRCAKCGVHVNTLRAADKPAVPVPSIEQLIELQNRVSQAHAEHALDKYFTSEQVAILSWALGCASASVVPGRDLRSFTNDDLHMANDLLLAQYLHGNPGALPSKTSAFELLRWSHERLLRAKGSAS
jgi:hypothetical protein